jgi:hypothetical protein
MGEGARPVWMQCLHTQHAQCSIVQYSRNRGRETVTEGERKERKSEKERGRDDIIKFDK